MSTQPQQQQQNQPQQQQQQAANPNPRPQRGRGGFRGRGRGFRSRGGYSVPRSAPPSQPESKVNTAPIPTMNQKKFEQDILPTPGAHPIVMPVVWSNLNREYAIDITLEQTNKICDLFKMLTFAEFKGLMKDLWDEVPSLKNVFHAATYMAIGRQAASHAFTHKGQIDETINNFMKLNIDIPVLSHEIAQCLGYAEAQGRRIMLNDPQMLVHQMNVLLYLASQGHDPSPYFGLLNYLKVSDKNLPTYSLVMNNFSEAYIANQQEVWSNVIDDLGSVDIGFTNVDGQRAVVPMSINLGTIEKILENIHLDANTNKGALLALVKARFEMIGINSEKVIELLSESIDRVIVADFALALNLNTFLAQSSGQKILEAVGKYRYEVQIMMRRLAKSIKLVNTSDLEGRGNLAQVIVRRQLEDGGQTIVESPFDTDARTITFGILFGLGLENSEFQSTYRAVVDWDLDASIMKYLNSLFIKQ